MQLLIHPGALGQGEYTAHPNLLRPAHTPASEPPKRGGRDTSYTGENGEDWKGKRDGLGIEEEVKLNNCSVGFFNYLFLIILK